MTEQQPFCDFLKLPPPSVLSVLGSLKTETLFTLVRSVNSINYSTKIMPK